MTSDTSISALVSARAGEADKLVTSFMHDKATRLALVALVFESIDEFRTVATKVGLLK